MSWLRLDDLFDTHPKVLALGSEVRRWTWLRVLLYTCRHGSPVIPEEIHSAVPRATRKFISECVAIGLVDVDSDGSHVVHHWLNYQAGNPKTAARQRKWRQGVDGGVDGGVDASRAGARARPVPYPSLSFSPDLDIRVTNGREDQEPQSPYLERLLDSLGVDNDTRAKLRRASHGKPEAAVVRAYEASRGPGVRDPLAVALAELGRQT